MATGFGMIPVRHSRGGVIRSNKYVVLASDGTALFVGDPVTLVNVMDANSEYPTITKYTAGNTIAGVIVGFGPDSSNQLTGNYRAASTLRNVMVCDDPDVIFQIQEDADAGVVAAADIASNYNANLNTAAAGSTVTGMSAAMLDSSTSSASAATLKIVGVKVDKVNAGAATAGAVLEVIIMEHAKTTVDSIGTP